MWSSTNSLAPIWLLWASSLTVLLWMSLHGANKLRPAALRRVWRDQRGAGYTLSYAMTLPIYILFVCLVVECTCIILARFGLDYAAYAAARSAIVHHSNLDDATAGEWAKRAAVQAFTPFANGFVERGSWPTPDPAVDALWKSYHERFPSGVAEAYFRAKHAYASKHVSVDLAIERTAPEAPLNPPSDLKAWTQGRLADVTARLDYRFPFHLPGIGWLIGERDAVGYYFSIHSEATLQSEAPKNNDEALGIEYETWR